MGGGGGMNPIDLEPGKRPLMKKGGSVKSSASKRADGIAKKVKPVEKWSDVSNQQHSVL
jgi:hypothetical protein